MTKVALSGASGNIGRLLRVELPKRGVELRSAGGRRPLQPLHEGEDVMHGDLRVPETYGGQGSHLAFRYLCWQSHFLAIQHSSRYAFASLGTLSYHSGGVLRRILY